MVGNSECGIQHYASFPRDEGRHLDRIVYGLREMSRLVDMSACFCLRSNRTKRVDNKRPFAGERSDRSHQKQQRRRDSFKIMDGEEFWRGSDVLPGSGQLAAAKAASRCWELELVQAASWSENSMLGQS